SPAYSTVSEEIIQRVVNSFPNLKVIFLARDPVERAWSQLSMGIRLGMISPFDVTNADEVIRNLLNPGVLLRSHPSRSSPGGNALFIQAFFASTFLTILRRILLSCAVRFSCF